MIWLALVLIPILLGLWAQSRVHSAYAQGMQIETGVTGAQAARLILNRNGLEEIAVEEVGGMLSDHYDPARRVLRLSSEVYRYPSVASVAIAAHEAGHALQHATRYAPLVVRSLAVPLAVVGPNTGVILVILGLMMHAQPIIWLGIGVFGGIFLFQLINLPVEFDASERARVQLAELGIIGDAESTRAVDRVLGAAAWTYVAASLQALGWFLYYLLRYGGNSRQDDR